MARYVYTYEEFVIVTEAPQSNRTQTKKNNIQIGNVQNGKNIIYNTDKYTDRLLRLHQTACSLIYCLWTDSLSSWMRPIRIFPASLPAACLSGSWWSTDRWRSVPESCVSLLFSIDEMSQSFNHPKSADFISFAQCDIPVISAAFDAVYINNSRAFSDVLSKQAGHVKEEVY